MKTKNYIDDAYYIIFGAYFLICFEMCLLIILLRATPLYFGLGWLFILIIGLISYFFYNRSYYFDKNILKIRIGFCNKKIPYDKIEKCYITHNNNLSYATSSKRIGISVTGRVKDIYISPDNMDDILIYLRKIVEPEEVKVVKTKAVSKPSALKNAKKSSKTSSEKAASKTSNKKTAVKKSETKKPSPNKKKTTPKKGTKTAK